MMRKRVLSPERTLALTRAVTMGASSATGAGTAGSWSSAGAVTRLAGVRGMAIMTSFSTRSGPTTCCVASPAALSAIRRSS